MKKLFGTDGIRGPANEPPLTPVTVEAIARVFTRVLRRRECARPEGRFLGPGGAAGRGIRVLLGHDGRRSADMLGSALTAGFLSEGASVVQGGLMTTPCLAHATREGGFDAGVMISASHNKASDNGIKLFGADGTKIADEVEAEIESGLAGDPEPAHGTRPGMIEADFDPIAAYVRFIRREALPRVDLSGIRIAVDCAHGGGTATAAPLLEAFGIECILFNAEPDGDNVNDGCGALHPENLAERFDASAADFGLCLDGDGDRAVFIDETGAVVHGDALLMVLARDLYERDPDRGGAVAVTVMSNLGLKKALARAGIRVVETPVGDRAVVAAMRDQGIVLGGENSGHVIFGPEHRYTGDGLFTCLKVAELLQRRGRTLHELAADFRPYPQKLVNVPVATKPPLEGLDGVGDARRRIENELGDEGRVVLRYSGTENLCRVMVEGPTDEAVERGCRIIADAVRAAIGARGAPS